MWGDPEVRLSWLCNETTRNILVIVLIVCSSIRLFMYYLLFPYILKESRIVAR